MTDVDVYVDLLHVGHLTVGAAAVESLDDLEDSRMPAETWAHLSRVVADGARVARALAG